MFSFRRQSWAALSGLAVALAVGVAHAQAPLDLLDPTPRYVFVYIENSSDLATVGQSFGAPFPATYSVAGNTGTLTITTAIHELIRPIGITPVPDTYTPIVIEFDLTTLEATSQPAHGVNADGQLIEGFTQNSLGTGTVGGFMGPSVPPLYCTSQAQVDNACMFVPSFCGQVCTVVPGAPYDPTTGLVNLVGSESRYGCDGQFCQGPVDFFTARGDFMLTEAPPMRAASPYATPLLIAILICTARRDPALPALTKNVVVGIRI